MTNLRWETAKDERVRDSHKSLDRTMRMLHHGFVVREVSLGSRTSRLSVCTLNPTHAPSPRWPQLRSVLGRNRP